MAERYSGHRKVGIALPKHRCAYWQETMQCTAGAWGVFLRLWERAQESPRLFFFQDMGNLSYCPNLRYGRLRSNLARVEAARVDQLSVTVA